MDLRTLTLLLLAITPVGEVAHFEALPLPKVSTPPNLARKYTYAHPPHSRTRRTRHHRISQPRKLN